MGKAIDGSFAQDSLPTLACGGTPLFDHGSGISYRCDTCNAVIGSIAQPSRCVELNKIAVSPTERDDSGYRGGPRRAL